MLRGQKRSREQAHTKVETISDFIKFSWNYEGSKYDQDLLWSLIPAFTELNNLVGMKKLKESVLNIVIYHLQGLSPEQNESFHTVLYGPPGVGKTTVSKILAKIYSKLGFIQSEKVIAANRSDFIAKYVGQSEAKTKKILESSLGGVLLIDEAYSLGQEDRPDSFSKAVVDQLNQFLSERAGEFVCIIAGYKEDLEKCFFGMNKGLERRFDIRFEIDGYTSSEMEKMFEGVIKRAGWSLDNSAIPKDFFRTNKDCFKFYGGDIDTFFKMCKIVHSRRIFGTNSFKRLLTREDIDRAIKKFSDRQPKVDLSSTMIYM